MAIEILSFPIKKMVDLSSSFSVNVYQVGYSTVQITFNDYKSQL